MGTRARAVIGAVPAVILAGGRATRMGGGDKTLRSFRGKPLLAHVLERLRAQADPMALSANGDPARFAAWGLPVLADPLPGQRGPLAGVLAAMRWADGQDSRHVLTVPGDAPFLPADLVRRLRAHGAPDRPALAQSAGRLHPVVGLWPVALADPLAEALAGGEARVGRWALDQGAIAVTFPAGPPDPFTNLNSPEDFSRAEPAFQ